MAIPSDPAVEQVVSPHSGMSFSLPAERAGTAGHLAGIGAVGTCNS